MEENLKNQLYAFGALSQEDVEAMVRRYYANAAQVPGFDPTKHIKSVWFPIDQINYMQSQLQADVANGADGIRVYFGNYPKTDSTGKDFPYPYTNSVIFVSTLKDGDDHIDYFTELHDFDPQDRGEQCQPKCGGTITTP